MMEYITIGVATGSFIVSFFAWKDKRKFKEEQEMRDEVKSLEEDVISMENDIDEVNKLIAEGKVNYEVLKERVSNEIRMLEKVSDKLDDISKELK